MIGSEGDRWIEKVRARAADLVAQGWTQGVSAVDERGEVCDTDSNEAVRWCLVGAIYRASVEQFGPEESVTVAAITELAVAVEMKQALPKGGSTMVGLAAFNDAPGRTAEEVEGVLRGERG